MHTDVDHLHHIHQESEMFLKAALDGPMDDPVPSCPDWTMTDLVGHLGVVQRFHGTHLLRGVTARPTDPRPVPPQDDLEAWFREGTAQLLANLERVGTDLPAWNWSIRPEDHTTAFWRRRMALEAAIHRWDAQRARGCVTGFDLALAVDGIDEVISMQVPSKRRGDEPEGTVTLVITDADVELQMIHGDPAAAAARISGRAGDVWLAVWGRLPMTDLAVEGDLALAHSVATG